eukprot:GAHX01001964.1.p1 GENE.GAHX01001964.1~~GAHX01001964.1.p1  ORF type:complete len:541 (-),score=119.73 GAHX01001964.1:65-1687(-)
MTANIIPSKGDLLTTASLSTTSKIFQLDIPSFQNPTFSYSHSGNELFLTSSSGNYALIDYKNFDLKHESIHESSIRTSTFLCSNFYSFASKRCIQINDFDGREIHILDDYNYFSNVGYLGYSRAHYLQTSLNSFGNLCYFDISIGKKMYTNKLGLKGYNKNTNFNEMVVGMNGVTCIANCSGLKTPKTTSSDSGNHVNGSTGNNTISFFSPKSRNPLATINAFKKGRIKNITTTNINNNTENNIEDVVGVLDNRNTLHLFDIRNYFEPFFKINLKSKFNTLGKHNSGNFNNYNINNNKNGCVKSVNNIENVKLLGDTVLGYGFNNIFSMKLDLNNDKDTTILYTEAFNERITNTSFCPFESVVGVTTTGVSNAKFDSLVVPNIGKYWKTEVSTYDEFYPLYDKGNIKAKKDLEIKSLIHKLPANTIRLNIKEKPLGESNGFDKFDYGDLNGQIYDGRDSTRNAEDKNSEAVKDKIVKEYKQDKKELEEINEEFKNVKVKRSKKKKMTLNQRKEIKKDDLRLKKQKVMKRMKEEKDKFNKM